MVTVETETERHAETTLVRVVVQNPHATAQTIRLETSVEGPVWPPRERAGIVPNWSDDTWNGTLGPGESRGIGFATPTVVEDASSVIEVVATARVDREQTIADRVLSELDPWTPPRDVLAESADQ